MPPGPALDWPPDSSDQHFAPERSDQPHGCHRTSTGSSSPGTSPRTPSCARCPAACRLQAADRRQHPPQGRRQRRLGGQARLLPRHRLGRAGRENCARYLARAGPSRSTAAWSGASGRARTAESARPSTSSPTPRSPSSSAPGTRPAAPAAATGSRRPPTSPWTLGDFAPAPVGGGSQDTSAPTGDDDIPFRGSPSPARARRCAACPGLMQRSDRGACRAVPSSSSSVLSRGPG